jgi:hypothetical protein
MSILGEWGKRECVGVLLGRLRFFDLCPGVFE